MAEQEIDKIYSKAKQYALEHPDCSLGELQQIIDPTPNEESYTPTAVKLYDRLVDDSILTPKISKHFIERAKDTVLNSRNGSIRLDLLQKILELGYERTYIILCYLYRRGLISSFEGIAKLPNNYLVTRSPKTKQRSRTKLLSQALALTKKYGRNDRHLLYRILFINNEDDMEFLYNQVERELIKKAKILRKKVGKLSFKILWKEMCLRRKTAKIILEEIEKINFNKGKHLRSFDHMPGHIVRLLREKKYDKCLNACNNLLIKKPKNAGALLCKGIIHKESKKHLDNKVALLCFNIITKLEPLFFPAWQYKAECHIKLEEYGEAKKSIMEKIAIVPAEAEGWCYASLIFFLEDNMKDALGILDEAEKRVNNKDTIALIKGILLEKDGRSDEAIGEYIKSKILAKNEEDQEVANEKLKRLINKKQMGSA